MIAIGENVQEKRVGKKIFSEDNVFNFINISLICIFVVMVIYPLLYTVFASISSGSAVDTGQVIFFPRELTFASYQQVITDGMFWKSYANAIFITVAGSTFSMVISSTGGYALSKKELPGHRFFNFILVFTMWFNAGLIPVYINLRDLGLLDSFLGLIIGFGVSAFNIILLRGAFQGVPKDLKEAAKIDGASEFQTFFLIYLPVTIPTLVTVWLMYAIARWNGFFWAMIVLRDQVRIPLQVYLRNIIVERTAQAEEVQNIVNATYSHTTVIYAVIVLSFIPILILFPFIQKFFKKGVMDGGVKE